MSNYSKYMIGEANSIVNASKKINDDKVEKFLFLLNACKQNKAKLIVSGVGKSGIIGKKIASTFCSLGVMSLYLNPLDSLHGDIGIVDEKDLLLVISNSGETDELVSILPYLSNRKVKIISILGKEDSTIAKCSVLSFDASVEREVCPLNLAPTTSSIVAMSIGDCLAAAWIEKSKLSEIDFALNHPAGALGKKLTLKTKDIMINKKEIEMIESSSTLDCIIESITSNGIGTALVKSQSNNNKIDGIITDGDIRRSFKKINNKSLGELKANDLMSKNPICIDQDSLAIDALNLMQNSDKGEVSILPVLDENEFVIGLVRLHDLIKAGF